MESDWLHVYSSAVKSKLVIAAHRLAGICLLMVATTSHGLDQRSEDSLLDIQTLASQLADTPRATQIETDKLLIESIRKNANEIYDRFRGADGSLPLEYSESLRADVKILRQALNESSEANRKELLQLVHEDLRLKLVYLQSSAGWTAFSPTNTLVQVSLTTMADGKSVAGYSVQCNPRRYGNASIFQNIFTKLTSPSVGKLAPGTYTCLLQKAGMQVKKDISVGLTGSAAETVEIEVSTL